MTVATNLEDERRTLSFKEIGPAERGKRPDKDYAVSWVRDFGQGRVFYTSLGHEDAVWNDPKVQEHMLGGIKWALGLVPSKL